MLLLYLGAGALLKTLLLKVSWPNNKYWKHWLIPIFPYNFSFFFYKADVFQGEAMLSGRENFFSIIDEGIRPKEMSLFVKWQLSGHAGEKKALE